MLPSQAEIEIPLLEALLEIGGQAKPKQLYPLVTTRFPTLTPEDLAERMDCGHIKWENRIQWVRQALIEAGDMASPQRGVWAITEQGRQRVAQHSPTNPDRHSAPKTLVQLVEDYETQFRSKLLDRLFELTPTQFEHFAKQLLTVYGFVQMTVTAVSRDGGLDGHGLLKVGLARMSVAFQCKRWENTVHRPEIDKFRGAIQGEYEQGIFFTTSSFSGGAQEASIKKGAVPIILLDGEAIVELMIDKQLGVQRRPLEIYEDQLEGFFGQEQE